ncbi:MAG TPA: TonB family protein, partial [Pyrinomonadaceae bacterium]|nr:TonB family protein [Pyrinomonadaceae bacterium]
NNNAPALPNVSAASGASTLALNLPASSAPSSSANASAPVVKNADDVPPPPKRAPVRPVSGGVLNGKALELPKPMYPETARRARVIGVVTVEVVIDVDGKVIGARAVSGPELLREAAERAARKAHFTPAMLSGQPVKISGVINYNFAL